MGRQSRWIAYGGLDTRPTTLPDPGQLIFHSKKVERFWLTSWIQSRSTLRILQASGGAQEGFASGAWTTEVAARVPIAEADARVPAFFT
jgi:hypothetical protein